MDTRLSEGAKQFLFRQLEVKTWIEEAIGKKLPEMTSPRSFQQALQNGDVLCTLAQKVKEDSLKHFHPNPSQPKKIKENILYFLAAVQSMGLPRHLLFSVDDLYLNRNFFRVVECLDNFALLTEHFKKDDLPQLKEIVPTASPKWTLDQINQAIQDMGNGRTLKPRATMKQIVRTKQNQETNVRKSLALAPNPVQMTRHFQNLNQDQKNRVTKGVIGLQAFARGKIMVRRYEKRITDHAYRTRVVQEILSSEVIYCRNLIVMNECYYKPLLDAVANGRQFIKPENLKILFPDSIQVIINFNKQFLESLEPRIISWTSFQCIGDIFLRFASFMKCYTQYIKDCTSALDMFKKTKAGNKDFAKFLWECKENPETMSLELDSFLILPVQRMPRYALLLQDLVKHTWKDHQDFRDLTVALQSINQVSNYINEKKRESESQTKIVELQKKFQGKFDNLVDPSRRFVRQDELTLVHGTKAKERDIFLFNDKLLVTKEVGNLLAKNGWKVLKELSLEFLTFEDTSPFSIVFLEDGVPGDKIVFTSKDEKESWVQDFKRCKEENEDRQAKQREIILRQAQEKAQQIKSQFGGHYLNTAPEDLVAKIYEQDELRRANSDDLREEGDEGSSPKGTIRPGSTRAYGSATYSDKSFIGNPGSEVPPGRRSRRGPSRDLDHSTEDAENSKEKYDSLRRNQDKEEKEKKRKEKEEREKERKEKEEEEKKEKERKEKEEKEKREKEKEDKEKEKLERKRLKDKDKEKEKEKDRKDREDKEKERKEREDKEKKEQDEKDEKERKEREEKEKKEEKEREDKEKEKKDEKDREDKKKDEKERETKLKFQVDEKDESHKKKMTFMSARQQMAKFKEKASGKFGTLRSGKHISTSEEDVTQPQASPAPAPSAAPAAPSALSPTHIRRRSKSEGNINSPDVPSAAPAAPTAPTTFSPQTHRKGTISLAGKKPPPMPLSAVLSASSPASEGKSAPASGAHSFFAPRERGGTMRKPSLQPSEVVRPASPSSPRKEIPKTFVPLPKVTSPPVLNSTPSQIQLGSSRAASPPQSTPKSAPVMPNAKIATALRSRTNTSPAQFDGGKKCPKCDASFSSNARICTQCGHKFAM
eukprot:TRINITY_DN6765_c0_g1_i1.p1 TRINITY_DN6765_c0_g1~~TRINITY_DN6765_c0_g1_i1.p1  ORF type:complete len:1125 (-),score=348.96 TRINITY_DN6765_c0_g1_i1:27-3344(-)